MPECAFSISDTYITALKLAIDPLQQSNEYGMDVYEHTIQFLNVFAIELVTFAVDFVPLAVAFAVEFVGFAVEFVALALQFVALAIELDAFAMGLGVFALELVAFVCTGIRHSKIDQLE